MIPPFIGKPTGGLMSPFCFGVGGILFANTTENASIKHTLKKYLRFFLFIIRAGVHKKYINT